MKLSFLMPFTEATRMETALLSAQAWSRLLNILKISIFQRRILNISEAWDFSQKIFSITCAILNLLAISTLFRRAQLCSQENQL